MRLVIDSLNDNPVTVMRRAGYAFQRQEQGEMSFVRVLGRSGYPRFHAYTRLSGTTLSISLHLDQKRHTYGEGTRHHGEYDADGPVKEESLRLCGLFGHNARVA